MPADLVPDRLPFLVCRWPFFSVSHGLSSDCMLKERERSLSLLIRPPALLDQGPTDLYDLSFNYLHKRPYLQTQLHWGLKLQHEFSRDTVTPKYTGLFLKRFCSFCSYLLEIFPLSCEKPSHSYQRMKSHRESKAPAPPDPLLLRQQPAPNARYMNEATLHHPVSIKLSKATATGVTQVKLTELPGKLRQNCKMEEK